ncbi:hypothetical protein IMY05_015G0021000 [Salix suchowensis]|nr:hypothetical protein IMY05_015G0021000 [Salix suchowensis]
MSSNLSTKELLKLRELEKIKSTKTRSLNSPSRPSHRRNPQLWHGIHFSAVADVRKKLFTADGLKKLIVECCGTKGDEKKRTGRYYKL